MLPKRGFGFAEPLHGLSCWHHGLVLCGASHQTCLVADDVATLLTSRRQGGPVSQLCVELVPGGQAEEADELRQALRGNDQLGWRSCLVPAPDAANIEELHTQGGSEAPQAEGVRQDPLAHYHAQHLEADGVGDEIPARSQAPFQRRSGLSATQS